MSAAPAGMSVILGGTRGIGAAVARRLARPDSSLLLGYLQDRAAAAALQAQLQERGAQVELLEGNVADASTLKRLGGIVDAHGGGCMHLVHCVAVTAFKPLSQVKPNQWSLTLDVSARSFLEAVRTLAEALARVRGAVVGLSSAGSLRHVPSYGALGPAKAALEATIRQLAVEWGPQGVRINGVRAGLMQGPSSSRFPPLLHQEVKRRTPLGRLGSTDEVAAVVDFLLGPDASWIQGQVIDVDGGFGIT